MVLLEQAIGLERMQGDRMGVVADLRVLVRQEVGGATPRLSGREVAPAFRLSNTPPPERPT